LERQPVTEEITVLLLAFSVSLFANETDSTEPVDTPDTLENLDLIVEIDQTTGGAITIDNPLPDFIKARFSMAAEYMISPGKANLLMKLKATDLSDEVNIEQWAQKTVREIQKERIANKKEAKANAKFSNETKIDDEVETASVEKTKNNKSNKGKGRKLK
jgi:hypothetical protein